MKDRFWETKSLMEMTADEWESLCDGCARCCLNKLEDEDTEELFWTDAVCRYLDQDSCQCSDYVNRSVIVPECVTLTPRNVDSLDWMPPTCAYRLLANGKPLPEWHPLLTGDRNSVHEAGVSVRGRVVSEADVSDLTERVVDWID